MFAGTPTGNQPFSVAPFGRGAHLFGRGARASRKGRTHVRRETFSGESAAWSRVGLGASLSDSRSCRVRVSLKLNPTELVRPLDHTLCYQFWPFFPERLGDQRPRPSATVRKGSVGVSASVSAAWSRPAPRPQLPAPAWGASRPVLAARAPARRRRRRVAAARPACCSPATASGPSWP